MSPPLLDTFVRRVRLEGTLSTRTALHVGAGGSGEPLGTDSPVVRDAAGRPYVPGSSLKGVVRSAAEALLRGRPGGDAGGNGSSGRHLWSCDPVAGGARACVDHPKLQAIRERVPADADDAGRQVALAVWEESCTVCRLFGSPALASRVRFPDLLLAGDAAPFELRNGVGIDRDRELAAPGVLYDFEAVPPGTAFGLTVVLDNPDDADVGLLLYLFEELDAGNLSLGGKTSRGLGLVRVEWHRVVETALERDNPFASLLSSRDLLAAPEAPGEPGEEATAAAGPPLPATGDPGAWRQLVDLVAEMPEVDKGQLGHRAAEFGLTKETINDRLGLGLEGRQARRSWDRALDVLVQHGFLVDHQGRLVPAGREPRAEPAAEPAAEEPAAPARDPELQRLYDRYVGAMARLWEEA